MGVFWCECISPERLADQPGGIGFFMKKAASIPPAAGFKLTEEMRVSRRSYAGTTLLPVSMPPRCPRGRSRDVACAF
jgi:hypothetical protein